MTEREQGISEIVYKYGRGAAVFIALDLLVPTVTFVIKKEIVEIPKKKKSKHEVVHYGYNITIEQPNDKCDLKLHIPESFNLEDNLVLSQRRFVWFQTPPKDNFEELLRISERDGVSNEQLAIVIDKMIQLLINDLLNK